MADLDFISDLARYPRESLSTVVKAWFDPSTPEGQAKIVRCALAMRNHDGGFMLIGFDNATGDPVANDRRRSLHRARRRAVSGYRNPTRRQNSRSIQVIVDRFRRASIDPRESRLRSNARREQHTQFLGSDLEGLEPRLSFESLRRTCRRQSRIRNRMKKRSDACWTRGSVDSDKSSPSDN
jgi:hypothetical protein